MPRPRTSTQLIEAELNRAFHQGRIAGWRRDPGAPADGRRRWIVEFGPRRRRVSWSASQVEAYLIGALGAGEEGA